MSMEFISSEKYFTQKEKVFQRKRYRGEREKKKRGEREKKKAIYKRCTILDTFLHLLFTLLLNKNFLRLREISIFAKNHQTWTEIFIQSPNYLLMTILYYRFIANYRKTINSIATFLSSSLSKDGVTIELFILFLTLCTTQKMFRWSSLLLFCDCVHLLVPNLLVDQTMWSNC